MKYISETNVENDEKYGEFQVKDLRYVNICINT